MVAVRKGPRVERNWFSEGGMRDLSFFDGGRPRRIADEAVKRATLCLDAVVPPAGEMPVVLGAGFSGILLHEAVGHGLEADFNRKDVSIYSGRVGEKVASELCTIVDDGTVKHSRGALAVDDEGTPGQRTMLIEKGVLRGYMNDLISARKMKADPTGNGRRQSYRHQPIPRMTTTYMLDGPHSEDEVFKGIERGIYAIDFSNGQVNIGAGDYTFFVNYGFLIEKGKVTRPIKDVNLIGNGPKSLQRVDRVAGDMKIPELGGGYCGKDGQRVPVNYGLPHVRVSKVTVGGRSAGKGQGKGQGGAA
jgi:TldD protein